MDDILVRVPARQVRQELEALDVIIDILSNYDRTVAGGLIDYLEHWNKIRPAGDK